MWTKFTERARRAVFFAQEEAGRLGENRVCTEHLLLGLVREDDSTAAHVLAQILARMNVGLDRVRDEIDRQAARGDGSLGQDMQLAPRAKRVIDLAYDEAVRLDNKFIGTEHLLLGLIREGEGLAGRVLLKLGVRLETTREAITAIQTGAAATPELKVVREQERREERRLDAAPSRTPHVKPLAAPGDLGEARAADGRTSVEMATDAATLRELGAIYLAKDRHGYQALLARGDGTEVVRLPVGTPLKLLQPSPGESGVHGGLYVRVLAGAFEGRAGWIFDAMFRRTGSDEAPFPPE